MAKYNYWHVVTAVSKNWQKNNPSIKVGMVITHQYKKDNESVCMFDLKQGKEYPSAYALGYLGRLIKGISGDKLILPLNRWINEKGFRKIIDEYEDALEKTDANCEDSGVRNDT